MLREQPEPTTLAALTRLSGRHENTVREHLEALTRMGLVSRHRAEPHGRGRPAWLYESTQAPAAGESEYAALAATLASSIARISDDPGRDGAVAGEEWGRRLARDRGAEPSSPDVARRRVLDLLDDLGFAPDPIEPDGAGPTAGPAAGDGAGDAGPDGGDVRLRRCPLLEAAHRHPEVVCGVHLGIIRGALDEHGAGSDGVDLVPFAEPGACRLTLPRAD